MMGEIAASIRHPTDETGSLVTVSRMMGEIAASIRLRRFLLVAGVAMALLAAGCSGVSSPPAGAPVASVSATTTASVDGATVPPESTDPDAPPPASTRPHTGSTTPAESAEGGESGAGEAEAQLTGGISWEDLEGLSFEITDDVVKLEDGSAVLSYGGASKSVFTLQDRAAQGDLDGDGDEDVAAHIVERSPGSGVFHLIVPVMDADGIPVAGRPVDVGDRIVMDSISINDGKVGVVLFDRALGEPFTVITRRTTLEIVLTQSAPQITVVDTEPIYSLPLPGPARADIDMNFETGAISATDTGTVEFRERQTHIVTASAGQALTATVDAPLGVWLDVRLDDRHVLASAGERLQRVEADLTASGPWKVAVVSSRAGEADYELTVEVLPPQDSPSGTAASTTTTAPIRVPGPVLPDRGAVMYLTFDDGPSPTYTPQVLDVLAKHGAKATFFLIGAFADLYPGLVNRIVAEGHTVANHTWNHESLAGLTKEAFDDTVGRTQAVLGSRGTPCLRPPSGHVGAFTQEWAQEHGLRLTMWNVDPADWSRPPAEEIADHIVDHARAGAVVLLHDGGGDRSTTVQGLDMALERLDGSGLSYKTLCR